MKIQQLKFLRLLARVPGLRTVAKKAAAGLAKTTEGATVSSIFTGQKMLLSVQDWVQYHIFLYGYYELAESTFWLHFTRNKKVVLGVGGNVGYFSLLAARGLAPGGKVYAFEPVSMAYNRFKENMALNKVENVMLEKMAISNQPGTLTLHVGNANNWGMSSINLHDQLSGTSETVPCVTVDGYVQQHNLQAVDIVKIDIEGSEFAAIDGMKETVRNHRPVVLVELLDTHLEKQGHTAKSIYQIFWDQQYTAYEILPGNKLKKLTEARSYDGLVCFYPAEKPIVEHIKLV